MFGGYRFEMIVGCMSAGKSSELIRRIERARLAYLPTIIVRPATDTRSKANCIESRNGRTSQAIVVDRATEILKYSSQAVVIGLDECQFFPDDIIDVVISLLNQKKKLIASGLDLDYTGKPFGPVPHLLALADRVDKLLAVCRKCGSDFACRTQRLVHSSEQILVGDAQYEARCIHCFDPPSDYQLQLPLTQRETPQLTRVSSGSNSGNHTDSRSIATSSSATHGQTNIPANAAISSINTVTSGVNPANCPADAQPINTVTAVDPAPLNVSIY